MNKLPLQKPKKPVGWVRESGQGYSMTPDYRALFNLACERIHQLRLDAGDASLDKDNKLVDSQPYWLDVDDVTGRPKPVLDGEPRCIEGSRDWDKNTTRRFNGE